MSKTIRFPCDAFVVSAIPVFGANSFQSDLHASLQLSIKTTTKMQIVASSL